jgi:hypothetical protein
VLRYRAVLAMHLKRRFQLRIGPGAQKRLSQGRESLSASVARHFSEMAAGLLRRWGREPFASLRERLWLRFGCFLDFFSAFIFVSHVISVPQKGHLGKGQKRGCQCRAIGIAEAEKRHRRQQSPGPSGISLTRRLDSVILESLRGVAPGVCARASKDRYSSLESCCSPGPGW